MDEPFDLNTAGGYKPKPLLAPCDRCGIPGRIISERFDSDVALFKYTLRCPKCLVEWTDSQ